MIQTINIISASLAALLDPLHRFEAFSKKPLPLTHPGTLTARLPGKVPPLKESPNLQGLTYESMGCEIKNGRLSSLRKEFQLQ